MSIQTTYSQSVHLKNQIAAQVLQPGILPEKETIVNEKVIDWGNFDKVFAYLELQHEFKQILGVKWYNADSIAYQIVCISMLCDMEMSGIARSKKETKENDKDESGSYLVELYRLKTNEYTVSIRIEAGKQSKARFVFTPNDEPNECDPGSDLIMRIHNLP